MLLKDSDENQKRHANVKNEGVTKENIEEQVLMGKDRDMNKQR